MTLSDSAPPPVAASDLFPPLWSLPTGAPASGVALARESGQVLCWDEHHWLYFLSPHGERQGQSRPFQGLAAAALADDGSALAAAGTRCEVARLSPDLSVRWQRTLKHAAIVVALDPFGRCLAVADAHGGLLLLNHNGRPLWQVEQPRPLHHLAFVPEEPFLLAASDFGLVVCLDALTGKVVWRDGLAVHCGGLATTGDGECIVLACFSDGLRRYHRADGPKGHIPTQEPCRRAALSFTGRHILIAGRANRLLLLDDQGTIRGIHLLERPASAVALAPLGDRAIVALAEDGVLALDLRSAVR